MSKNKQTLSELIKVKMSEYDPKNAMDMPTWLSISIYNAGYAHTEKPCPFCKTMTSEHFVGCGREGL